MRHHHQQQQQQQRQTRQQHKQQQHDAIVWWSIVATLLVTVSSYQNLPQYHHLQSAASTRWHPRYMFHSVLDHRAPARARAHGHSCQIPSTLRSTTRTTTTTKTSRLSAAGGGGGGSFGGMPLSSPLVLGIPFLGRFRKKRQVDQTKPLQVGDDLPSIDVEVLQLVPGNDANIDNSKNGTGDKVVTTALSIREVLGNGTSILVGMPGAFTPTCTRQHLPGYIDNAPRFAALGIDKIAVVTTNDRFVNEEWSAQFGLLSRRAVPSTEFSSSNTATASTTTTTTAAATAAAAAAKPMEGIITMLCDGDGDLVRSMGLAEDMGFGVGIRSKRFALVAENGIVTTLLTDEGMDDCSCTSAASLLRILEPEAPATTTTLTESDMEGSMGMVAAAGAAAVAVAILVALFVTTSDSTTNTGSPPPPPSQATYSSSPAMVQSGSTKVKGASPSTYNVLNDYI